MQARRESEDPRVVAASNLLGTYVREGRTRTDLLKELAAIVVELRGDFTVKDGAPDLGGRSHAYRATIRDIYTRAGVPPEHLDTIQTALRYHVNNLLHERYPTDALEAAGLGRISAKDRLTLSRDAIHELNSVLQDQVKLATHLDELAARLDVDALLAEPAVRARAARQALLSAKSSIREAISRLNDGLPETRGGGKKAV